MKGLALAAVILTSCTIYVADGIAAPKSAKTFRPDGGWNPAEYNETVDRLPSGYQGTDPKRFYELFKAKTEAMTKGEFETSEEFSKRSSDADAVLAPISTQKVYAFRVQEITPKYDADKQTYEFHGVVGDYSCDPAGLTGQDRGTLVCKVATVVLTRDRYTGSNAYGASRIVERTRGTDLAIAIPNTPKLFDTSKGSGSVFGYPDGNGSVRLVDSLQMPLEKAKAIKGSIGVLFIGNVTGTGLVEGRALLIEPKVDKPTDIFFTTAALPFSLKKVVYYVIPTGEILAQRSFD